MIRDDRGRRVAFVSHCLLNQNVRYMGGAFFAGAVPSVLETFAAQNVGFVQMPCPEQLAWGGVTKRLLLRAYGSRALYVMRAVFLPLFVVYTRVRYWWLARRVARDIRDYVTAGYEVVGIVGVDDSPSCGVRRTLDVKRALPVIASLDDAVDRETFNARAVRDCLVPGRGFFISALRRALARCSLEVPMLEYHVDSGSID